MRNQTFMTVLITTNINLKAFGEKMKHLNKLYSLKNDREATKWNICKKLSCALSIYYGCFF